VLGGGSGSGNEALEDFIQAQINDNAVLKGRINVSINNLGDLEFKALVPGASTLTIDPIYTAAGSVNFNNIVEFSTNRRSGQLNVSDLDFTGAPTNKDTSFTITVGNAAPLVISLADDFGPGSIRAAALGGATDADSGIEALEDEIQTQINESSLPGAVKFSIGSDGKFVFEITDPTETSLQVKSDSTPAQAIGSVDVSNSGFDFATTPYNFTVTRNDGTGALTSQTLVLDSDYDSGEKLVTAVNNLLRSDAADPTGTGFKLSVDNPEVVARLDPVSGVLIFETGATGPNAEITVDVSLPIPPLAEAVIAHNGGVAQLGDGPNVDFAQIATFAGSELSNSGAAKATNGYGAEVIRVVDVLGNSQLVSIPAGSRANEVANQFAVVNGVTAKGTTVAYVTKTNSGDANDLGSSGSSNVLPPDTPVKFKINNTLFEGAGTTHDARIQALHDDINSKSNTLTAKIVTIEDGDDLLQIKENNGNDLVFGGDSESRGSITVNSGILSDPVAGTFVVGPDSSARQLANLNSLTNDTIVIGGIVEFTLDEGVILSDAELDANGNPISEARNSIFGRLEDEDALAGEVFELNTFDPDNPNSYYRSSAISVFDSLGIPHTLTQFFVKERPTPEDGDNSVWSVYFQIDGQDVGGIDPDNPELAKATVKFNSSGLYSSNQDAIYVTNWQPKRDGIDNRALGAAPEQTSMDDLDSSSNFEVDFTALTQFGGDFAVQSNSQDGYTRGQLTGLEIGSDGVLSARFTNGQSSALGVIALAKFEDPSKLANIGGTRFAATAESGPATTGPAGTGGLGVVQSGALEDSNVDLSEQLVQLIVSQRNFQAAAQIIESIDTSTQTIINL
jgi:flagellar hook protein FlgE